MISPPDAVLEFLKSRTRSCGSGAGAVLGLRRLLSGGGGNDGAGRARPPCGALSGGTRRRFGYRKSAACGAEIFEFASTSSRQNLAAHAIWCSRLGGAAAVFTGRGGGNRTSGRHRFEAPLRVPARKFRRVFFSNSPPTKTGWRISCGAVVSSSFRRTRGRTRPRGNRSSRRESRRGWPAGRVVGHALSSA